ncbi:MAG: hypothetical protein JXX14_12495 [Deltaproteobacteria bacterium]|nr:hypothetical protein [Deltaproteobacteria bacterium]
MHNNLPQSLCFAAVWAILLITPVVSAAQSDNGTPSPENLTNAEKTEAPTVEGQSSKAETDDNDAVTLQPNDTSAARSENAAESITTDTDESVVPAPEAADSKTADDSHSGTTDGQVKDIETPPRTTDVTTSSAEHSAARSVEIKAVPVPTVPPGNPADDAKADIENKRHMFVVTYNMAQPRGKTADFVDKFSFEGFGFEYRFLIRKQLSVGVTFNWNTFERKEAGTNAVDSNTTITATRIKMTDLIQLAPCVQYHLKKQSSMVVPFVGLNMGPYYTSQIIDWGWWYERVSSWQFGFTPEIGIRLTRLPIPLYMSLRYSYAIKANDLPTQQAFGINVGIAFLK